MIMYYCILSSHDVSSDVSHLSPGKWWCHGLALMALPPQSLPPIPQPPSTMILLKHLVKSHTSLPTKLLMVTRGAESKFINTALHDCLPFNQEGIEAFESDLKLNYRFTDFWLCDLGQEQECGLIISITLIVESVFIVYKVQLPIHPL